MKICTTYYHKLKFSEKWDSFAKLIPWNAPIITSWHFLKNKVVLLMSLANLSCPYYHELKFSKKCGRFYEVTWKFALLLLSRANIFAKISQFCWCGLKIWPSPFFTSWNFSKNKAVLLMWLANLSCPYHHEMKFSLRKDSFKGTLMQTWKSPYILVLI